MEQDGEVGGGWQMGVAVCVYESNVAEGTMDSLNIVEMERVSFKEVKEVLDLVEELESFNSGETNLLGWDVP